MIIDTEYRNGNLIVSYVNESGNIKLKYFPWSRPTKFIETSHDDDEKIKDYTTWNKKAIKKIYTKYPDRYSIYEYLDSLNEEDQETIFGYNEPNIFFIDIETEILDSKPIPHLAPSKVLSISIVNKDKALVMGMDPLNKNQINNIQNKINLDYGSKLDRKWDFKYVCYKNEYDLLNNFFKIFVTKMAVLTGWNFISFDWTYLVNRYRNIGGDPTVSSPTSRLKEAFNRGERQTDFSEIPYHKIVVDYMELYAKWDQSIKVKESNSLDFVAGQILGEDFGKVSYTGDLKKLYETDKEKFMFYNVIDSILVQLIHEKTKYIDILYGMATLGRITAKNAISTLALTEGILRKKLKEKKNILLCKKTEDSENDSKIGSVAGGFVLPPVRGMAAWTCCYDFSSLYPTTIRLLNISADSYKGQLPYIFVNGEYVPDFNANYSLFNGKKIYLDENDIVLLNGSVFVNEIGVVSEVMGDVYSDRKMNKKLMQEAYEKYNELKKLKKEVEESILAYN